MASRSRSYATAFSAFLMTLRISEYFRYLLVSSPSLTKVTVTDLSDVLLTVPSTSALPNLKRTVSPSFTSALMALSLASFSAVSEAFTSALFAFRSSETSSFRTLRSSMPIFSRSYFTVQPPCLRSVPLGGTSFSQIHYTELFHFCQRMDSDHHSVIRLLSLLNYVETNGFRHCLYSPLSALRATRRT